MAPLMVSVADASLRMIVSTQAERYAGQWKRELASMGDHGPTRTRIRGHVANFADFAQHIVHSLRLDPGDGDEPLLSYLRAYAEMLLEQEFRVASIEDLFGFYDGIRQLMAELSGRGISLTQRLRFSAPDWTFARFQAELDRRCRLALWQSLYFDPAFQRVASGAFSALTEIAGSVTGMKPIEALRIGRQLEPLRDRLDLLIEESADVADGAS